MTEHVSHYHSNIAFVMRMRAEQIIVKYPVKLGKTSELALPPKFLFLAFTTSGFYVCLHKHALKLGGV